MSMVLIASVWTTALVTTFLAQQLLEGLSFLYAAVTTGFIVAYLIKTKRASTLLHLLNVEAATQAQNPPKEIEA